MPLVPNDPESVNELWRTYLTRGDFPGFFRAHGYRVKDLKRLFRTMPTDPRCRMCYVPYKGLGGWVAKRFFDRAPSKLNPQVCNVCDQFVAEHHGGAEVELTMLFADVRGSTTLAERMAPTEFSDLINRFYQTAAHVLIHADAMLEKLIGDEVAAFFVPGMAGPQHARRAVEAGQKLLRATGHGEAGGPWLPIGIGLHTGPAYVGAVGGADGVSDIVVLGDTVNVAARLAAQAGPGEILVSHAAAQAANLPPGPEQRRLPLKGRTEPVDVLVLRTPSPGTPP